MKRIFFPLLALLAASSAFGQLSSATNVYILPMAGGLDQYLALQLTRDHVLQVVTDAARADVILTSSIGADFEQILKDLYTEDSAEEETDDITTEFANPRMRPFSRARGTLFLVERSTGNVLWSDFVEPNGGEPKDVERAARRLVDDLQNARKEAIRPD